MREFTLSAGRRDRRASAVAVLTRLEAREVPAGALDAAFGQDGFAAVAGFDEPARDLPVVAIDGLGRAVTLQLAKPLYLGYGTPASLTRTLPDGTPDPTFGDGGRVLFADRYDPVTGYGFLSNAYNASDPPKQVLAFDQSNRVLIAFTEVEANPGKSYRTAVVRLTEAGAIDRTFGEQGFAFVSVPRVPEAESAVSGTPAALRVLGDGSVLLAGTARYYSGASDGTAYGFAARLTPQGAADPAYGNGGAVAFEFRNLFAIDDLGRLFAAGYVSNYRELYGTSVHYAPSDPPAAGHRYLAVTRLTAAGRPDPAFGDNGTVKLAEARGPDGLSYNQDARALLLRPAGHPGGAGVTLVTDTTRLEFTAGGVPADLPGPTASLVSGLYGLPGFTLGRVLGYYVNDNQSTFVGASYAPDGALVIARDRVEQYHEKAFTVERLRTDGTADAGYRPGQVALSASFPQNHAVSFALRAGGQAVVLRRVADGLGLVQFTADGTGVAGLALAAPPTAPAVVHLMARLTGVGSGVRVTRADGSVAFEVAAYEAGFTGPVNVAVADLTGDGVDDIVTTPGAGGGPRVRVFDGVTGFVVRDFFAFEPALRTGLTLAVSPAGIVVGAGAGGGPRVAVFDAATGSTVRDFFAFEPAARGGVSVAAAGDFLAAGELTGGSRVRLFDAAAGPDDGPGPTPAGEFEAFEPGFRGGVSLAADFSGGAGRLAVGAGAGGGPRLRTYAVDLAADTPAAATDDVFAGDEASRGGVQAVVAVPGPPPVA